MSPLFAEVIPNELPFRNSFWAHEECVFCQEVFTLASFVTITLGLVFAILAVMAILYWYSDESRNPHPT